MYYKIEMTLYVNKISAVCQQKFGYVFFLIWEEQYSLHIFSWIYIDILNLSLFDFLIESYLCEISLLSKLIQETNALILKLSSADIFMHLLLLKFDCYCYALIFCTKISTHILNVQALLNYIYPTNCKLYYFSSVNYARRNSHILIKSHRNNLDIWYVLYPTPYQLVTMYMTTCDNIMH